MSPNKGAKTALYESIKTRPVVYVTRDIERALGIQPANGYFIISNASPYAKDIQKEFHKNVLLIDNKQPEPLDTYDLLSHPDAAKLINKLKARVMVFQPTTRVEELCKTRGWELLNPSAELSRRVEEKVTQVEWLGEHKHLLPPHSVLTCKELVWENLKYVVQFNHGHTGEGTLMINHRDDVENLKQKFPDRPVRKTNFIDGDVYTCNVAIVQTDKGPSVIPGNISYQITGIFPFTDKQYATIGNDWSLPTTTLSSLQRNLIKGVIDIVGQKLARQGWKGLFGIDLIIESKKGTVYLLEINARQPASTAFESDLQARADKNGMSIFELHLAGLTGSPVSKETKAIPITSGAQILQRVTSFLPNSKAIPKQSLARIREQSLHMIVYNNSAHNADLLRIQTDGAYIKAPNQLNDQAEHIKDSIHPKRK